MSYDWWTRQESCCFFGGTIEQLKTKGAKIFTAYPGVTAEIDGNTLIVVHHEDRLRCHTCNQEYFCPIFKLHETGQYVTSCRRWCTLRTFSIETDGTQLYFQQTYKRQDHPDFGTFLIPRDEQPVIYFGKTLNQNELLVFNNESETDLVIFNEVGQRIPFRQIPHAHKCTYIDDEYEITVNYHNQSIVHLVAK